MLVWLSLRVHLISPSTPDCRRPNSQIQYPWFVCASPTLSFLHGFQINCPQSSRQPIYCLFVAILWFFFSRPIPLLKGKIHPSGYKRPWAQSLYECMTKSYHQKINTAISRKWKSHSSHYAQRFWARLLCLVFFLKPDFLFALSRGEEARYLAFHFMDLHFTFSGRMWVDICKSPLGELQKKKKKK